MNYICAHIHFYFTDLYKSGTSLQNTATQWYYLSVYSIHQKKTKNCSWNSCCRRQIWSSGMRSSLLVNLDFFNPWKKLHFAKINYVVFHSGFFFFFFEIPQFRGPQTVGPVPSAVGVSIAIDKITAAVSSVEDSVSLFFGKWGIFSLLTVQ